MNRLILFVADECKKLLLQTKFKILIALAALFPVAVGLCGFFLSERSGIRIFAPGKLPVFVLELLSGFVLPVLAVFLVSELLAGEFQDGTIKNLFALPVSKGIIYVGKLLAGAATLGILLLVMGVSGFAVSIAVNGPAAFGSLGGFLISYPGTFLFLVTVLAITGCISLLTGGSGMSVFVNLFLWLGAGVAGTFITAVKPYLPVGFAGWYRPLVYGVNPAGALPPLLYMLSYCAIFIIAGMTLFERKEI